MVQFLTEMTLMENIQSCGRAWGDLECGHTIVWEEGWDGRLGFSSDFRVAGENVWEVD